MTFDCDHLNIYLKNSRIQYDRVPNSVNMPIYHFHEFYEIYYLMSGERNYFIKNKMYSMKKGDIALINSNVIHRTISPNNSVEHERILIYINKSFLNSLSNDIREYKPFSIFSKPSPVIRLDTKKQNFVETLLYNIVDSYKKEREISKTFAEMLITDLLVYLKMYADDSDNFVYGHFDKKYEKISEIISFISQNYMYDISLSDIKNKFYVSISYLTKTFKMATGFTFSEYLNCVRVKEAQYLMNLSDFNISQIAEKVGFNSVNHFCRVFKKVSGISPRTFKKNSNVRSGSKMPISDIF